MSPLPIADFAARSGEIARRSLVILTYVYAAATNVSWCDCLDAF